MAGFHTLAKKEADELHKLSLLVEAYEDTVQKIMPLPVSIPAIIQHKIREMNISQAKLADMLGLGTAKLSQLLNGKRPPDVPFSKAVHSKLVISGDFLLEHSQNQTTPIPVNPTCQPPNTAKKHTKNSKTW